MTSPTMSSAICQDMSSLYWTFQPTELFLLVGWTWFLLALTTFCLMTSPTMSSAICQDMSSLYCSSLSLMTNRFMAWDSFLDMGTSFADDKKAFFMAFELLLALLS